MGLAVPRGTGCGVGDAEGGSRKGVGLHGAYLFLPGYIYSTAICSAATKQYLAAKVVGKTNSFECYIMEHYDLLGKTLSI